MRKDWFAILIAFLVGLYPVASALAQTNDPIIQQISPSQIPANEKNIISLDGENLVDPVSIYISSANGDTALLYETVSSEKITVTVPALEVGSYTLCVRFATLRDCREIKVVGSTLSVVSIEPAIIYNPLENRVSIVLEHGPEITHIYLNGAELQISSVTRDVSGNTDEVVVLVPPGSYTGPASFTARLSDGQEVAMDVALTIKGPINAAISNVTPGKVLRYSGDQNTVVISGTNLDGTKSISWSPIVTCTVISTCDNVVVTNSQITISIPISGYVFANTIPDGKIAFEDGSELPLANTIVIVDPVFPWHFLSWVALFAFIILFTIIWSGIYAGSFGYEQRKNKANQTAPRITHSILMLITGLGISFLFAIGAWVVWDIFGQASIVFVASTLLITVNLVFTFQFWMLSQKFGNSIPGSTSAIFALTVAILTIGFPILFTYLMETLFAVLANSILLLIVATAGVWSVEYTRRRLEDQKIKGPSDVEIYNRVAEDVFRKGQLNATNDYGELPKDMVVAAFSKFYTANKETLKIEFSDYIGTLGFVRHENIGVLQHAFENLRAKLKVKDGWSPADVNGLVKTLLKEFGFKGGKGLAKLRKSDHFFTYAIQPTGVESVLPDPFPLIVYAANQAIETPELDELQDILNQLDIKSRFAILVTINETKAIQDRIQERFNGIGRENIVVLGETECKHIIGSADSLRLAFMKVLQGQVDLLVFKPYTVDGATPVDMFYGRKQEINSVLERISDGSVAVLGARRIGKTSMLQAVKRILDDRGKLVLYLDCYAVFDYSTLLQNMELEWSTLGAPKNVLKRLNDLPGWLMQIQELYPKRQIVLLLDEIDGLIKYDQKQRQQEKLFRMFRSLAQKKRCQFIFSGERLILEQLSNSKSPFFNFVSPIKLGLFDVDITRNIVMEPMKLIGSTIQNEKNVIQSVFEYSGGHPSLIQYICSECLESMNKRKNRILDLETVSTIVHGQTYHDRYLETYWSQSSPLEKAVSIVIAEHQPMTLKQIHSKLRDQGFQATIEQIRKAIRYLSLCQILVSNGEEYSINLVKFKELLSVFTYTTWMDDLCQEWTQVSKEKP